MQNAFKKERDKPSTTETALNTGVESKAQEDGLPVLPARRKHEDIEDGEVSDDRYHAMCNVVACIMYILL